MSEPGSLQDAVWEELKAVRKKGVDRLDALLAKNESEKAVVTSLLERAASALPDYRPNLTRAAAIRLLLKTEIPLVTDAAARDWLPSSFGLTKETQGKSPTECRKVAARLANHPVADFGRSYGREQTGLGVLAAQIVSDCLVGSAPIARANTRTDSAMPIGKLVRRGVLVAGSSQMSVEWPEYIRRDEYHEKFQKSLDAGRRVIELIGPPGVGKSWLADGLTREQLAGKKASTIRFANDKPDIADLRNALRENGTPTEVPQVVANTKAYMAELICGEESPEFVILDGLVSAESIYDLLPDNFNAVMVVTAHRQSTRPYKGREILHVEEMSPPDSFELVKRLTRDISEGDCQLLARSLYYHPLLISYACPLVMHRSISLSQFSADVKRDVASLARTAKTAAGAALSIVLQQVVKRILEESKVAYDIAECLSFLDAHPFVDSIFVDKYARVANPGMNSIVYMQALDVLQSYALVSMIRDKNGVIQELTMHALGQELIQAINPSRAVDVERCTAEVVEKCSEQISAWEAGIDARKLIPASTAEKLEGWHRRMNEPEGSSAGIINDLYAQYKYAAYMADAKHTLITFFARTVEFERNIQKIPGADRIRALVVLRMPPLKSATKRKDKSP